MKQLQDFLELLTSLVDLIVLWLDCLRQPFLTISKALTEYPDDQGRLRYTVKLWIISFMISLALQLPVYWMLEMDWERVEFLLPSALLLLFSFMGSGLVAHLGLKASHVNSNFAETWLIYAVLFAAHAPFFTLLAYPALVDMLLMVQHAKASHDNVLDVITEVWSLVMAQSSAPPGRSLVGLVGDAISVPMYLYMGVVIVMFMHVVRVRYEAPKYAVFRGVSLGVGVFAPVPLLGLLALYWAVIYQAL
jgi:hypothetical protein